MRITSGIIFVTALGCTNPESKPETSLPPSSQTSQVPPIDAPQTTTEIEMSQTSTKSDNSEPEPTVSMLALGVAVPTEEMPQFLQQRMAATPAVLGLNETRSLDPETRQQVLAVVEKAIERFRQEALRFRAGGSPPERTADELEAFIEAARQ